MLGCKDTILLLNKMVESASVAGKLLEDYG